MVKARMGRWQSADLYCDRVHLVAEKDCWLWVQGETAS